MERQLAGLAEILGATAMADDSLGALLLRWAGHGPAFNHAALVRWTEADWREQSARLVGRMTGERTVPALVVSDGLTEPADLSSRLEGEGWVSLVEEDVLWTRRAGIVPHLDPSMRIEAVTRASAEAYEALERSIFSLPPADAVERMSVLVDSIEAGTQRAYLVRVGGEPVATARLVPGDGVAALHGIGVEASHRREGYGSLITTVATRAALAMGNRLVWLSVAEANEAARALYEGLDYRPAFRWRLLVEAGSASG
jgi:ribosomal protein S18 acetylase RimI-like enzyme